MDDNRRGWWADLVSEVQGDKIGSKLWALEREGKVNNQTPIELENILRDAFNWLLIDGIAQRVSVIAERTGTNEVKASIKIFKPEGDNIPFKFIWDGQSLKLLEES